MGGQTDGDLEGLHLFIVPLYRILDIFFHCRQFAPQDCFVIVRRC